ncbi:cytochrome c [Pelomonas sp. SE-A7]|uniref:c-type cytochrome n=1 Tax=Pelomonas sp. SE-A7 TaxID=3054953 RepID=UPI00259CB518|nr:cytochrome c [Pelomonas sp. SE-A7]MDM4765662.1 cytochrome c [Pelomonas sp. SE-A7]
MKSWIKRSLMALAGLVLAVAAVAAYGFWNSERLMNRRIEIPPYKLADSTDLDRGRYLFETRGCAECHGANGGGKAFVDTPEMRVKGPDISAGGAVKAYANEDWDRILRHGVKPDGRPAFIMPSEDYNRLTDADLAALVAYIKSLPAAGGSGLEARLPPPVRIFYGLGLIKDAAAKIDHALPPQKPVPEGLTVEHGAYIAATCMGCHGEHYSGGKVPGGPPDWPAAANLTPGEGSAMVRYPDAARFIAMMRSGQRPDGTKILVMPFESFGKLNDQDLGALRLYLASLPPRPAGQR